IWCPARARRACRNSSHRQEGSDMKDIKDHTSATHQDGAITRRNLLAGSVGAAVGGLLVADAAMAQTHAAHGTMQTTGRTETASHASHSGSLSNRIYSVNP